MKVASRAESEEKQPVGISVSYDSSIGQHFLDNNQLCALQYNKNRFSIFSTGCSTFHLSALEATFIKTFQLLSLMFFDKKNLFSALKIFH